MGHRVTRNQSKSSPEKTRSWQLKLRVPHGKKDNDTSLFLDTSRYSAFFQSVHATYSSYCVDLYYLIGRYKVCCLP